MLPLLRLNRVRWVRVAGATAALLIILQLLYIRQQHLVLQQTQVIYKNPRVVHQVRVVRVQGPVRIVTRTVEVEGRREVTVEEVRAPATEVHEDLRVSEPVFQPSRTDRWLVGASVNPFHPDNAAERAGYVGYSFRNRLDLCGGVEGRGRARVLVMLRF